jgi:NAD(P)-dependent dehydrogenase (short-subunit alcohol dehydrogenase family)
VPRVFITGSTDGLGRGAAGILVGEGHEVVLHARSRARAAALGDLVAGAAGVVIGDLSSAAETREVADQVNGIGRMDAVTMPVYSWSRPVLGPPKVTRGRWR